MRPDITVVIPTVTGREEYLRKCIASYEANTVGTFEILTYLNLPGVAFGWQRGAEASRGDFITMTNDDAEVHPGWDVPARQMAEQGIQPAPRLFNPDGTPWATYGPHGEPARIGSVPFLARDWWEHITPLPPGMHYYTDDWITLRLSMIGVSTRLCHGYDLTHSWAPQHRGAGWSENGRMVVDCRYFDMARMIVDTGAKALLP